MKANAEYSAFVHSIAFEAPGVIRLELRSRNGAPLPRVEPGAHIDLQLPNKMVRSYSLIDADERRFVIGVKRENEGGGGSRHIHENLRVGQELIVTGPRNNFRLDEQAPHVVLIGGGIGITPLLFMARSLSEAGRSWELHYAAKTPRDTAFSDIVSSFEAKAHLYFSRAEGGVRPDIAQIVKRAPAGAHFYCCGPRSMLAEFETATASLPPSHVHLERFAGDEADTTGSFSIQLARTGGTYRVEEGSTILDVLLEHDVQMDYSCTEGVCGSCMVTVLDGEPDHKDFVLSSDERRKNDRIITCCSRAKSSRLVLDI